MNDDSATNRREMESLIGPKTEMFKSEKFRGSGLTIESLALS
jgi:hypothetical protein